MIFCCFFSRLTLCSPSHKTGNQWTAVAVRSHISSSMPCSCTCDHDHEDHNDDDDDEDSHDRDDENVQQNAISIGSTPTVTFVSTTTFTPFAAYVRFCRKAHGTCSWSADTGTVGCPRFASMACGVELCLNGTRHRFRYQ